VHQSYVYDAQLLKIFIGMEFMKLYGDIGGAWELKHSSHNYVILVIRRLVSVSCVFIYYYLHVTFCCVPTMCNSVPD